MQKCPKDCKFSWLNICINNTYSKMFTSRPAKTFFAPWHQLRTQITTLPKCDTDQLFCNKNNTADVNILIVTSSPGGHEVLSGSLKKLKTDTRKRYFTRPKKLLVFCFFVCGMDLSDASRQGRAPFSAKLGKFWVIPHPMINLQRPCIKSVVLKKTFKQAYSEWLARRVFSRRH